MAAVQSNANSRSFGTRSIEALRKHYQTPLTLIAIFLIWQFGVMAFKAPEYILPTPASALGHLFFEQPDANYNWMFHITTKLYEVVISFVVTGVVGIIIAIFISWSKSIYDTIMPLFIFVNSLPIIAIAPIILLWFGYGLFTNTFIAFLISFFPVVINTSRGLTEVDEELLDLVRYLNGTKFQIFIKIRFPNSLPYIFSGLKISSTMCVVGAIVGEFIASDRGLGYIIINSQYAMDTPPIFASLILVSVIGVSLFLIVSLAQRYLMPWHQPEQL